MTNPRGATTTHRQIVRPQEEEMATPGPRTASSGSGSGGGDGGAIKTARTASLFACVVTLSNTLLGVSVVGVAGGFARAGSAVRAP